MIIPQKKILFIHIKKTGGTSVEMTFKKKFPNVPIKKRSHLTFNDYAKRVGERVLEDYYCFTIIRNPWDRIASLYWMRRGLKGNPSHFQHWVEDITTHKFWQQQKLTYRHQYDWLSNKEGVLKVKNIIRFEDMSKGWKKICKDLKMPGLKLPHLNKSNNKGTHFKKMYKKKDGKWNDKTIERIYQFNHRDCEHFDYSFK